MHPFVILEHFHRLQSPISIYVISPNPSSPNYRAISAEKKLAMMLYFFKDTGSLGMTANTFGVAINTTSAVIAEVCEVITKKMVQNIFIFLEARKAYKESCLNLRQNLVCPKHLVVSMELTFQSSVQQKTRKTFSAISSIIPSAHKQYVITGVISWMWSARGLGVVMMLKFSRIAV